jgi:putative transcriptional regulator
MNRIEGQLNTENSLTGHIIVASPQLRDPLLAQSVCLIVEQSQHGIAGIVLNRPFLSNVQALWGQLTADIEDAGPAPEFLHFGGPLPGPVVAIHDRADLADAGNEFGVFLAAESEKLKQLSTVGAEHYRLLIGHVGWKTAKLLQQIRRGDWYVLSAKSELVFSSDDEMWDKAIKTHGGDVVREFTGLKSLPKSALLN